MRKLGIITDINDIITISIWDEKVKRVVKKQINNPDNQEYKLLSIVEYLKDNNSIALLTNINLTDDEKIFLVNTLKEVINDIRYQETFLNEIDALSRKK